MKVIIDIPEKTYNEIRDNDMISVADFPMLMYSIKHGEVLDTRGTGKSVADMISEYCMKTQEKSIKPINDNVALGWEYK